MHNYIAIFLLTATLSANIEQMKSIHVDWQKEQKDYKILPAIVLQHNKVNEMPSKLAGISGIICENL